MSPLPASDRYDFCSQFSIEGAAEPLYATATRADVWLALEYTGRWAARAFGASDLSEAVKEHVAEFQDGTANTRVQFIRRMGNYEPEPIHFFVALAHLAQPRLYAFELQSYEDLLDLDLRAVVDEEAAYDRYLSEEPLFFTCNNGLRDACCAKFGVPVHQALAAAEGDQAWQCTHIGGHRLAPNLLFLPHALSYGRVTPEAAPGLAARYRQGELEPDYLRGRTIYDRPVQAALHFLREETGNRALDAYAVHSAEKLDDGRWQVVLANEEREQVVLHVEGRRWHEPVFKTCEATEPAVVEHYHRVGG